MAEDSYRWINWSLLTLHKAGGLPLGPTLAQGHHGQVWNEDWTKDFSKVQKMREAWSPGPGPN